MATTATRTTAQATGPDTMPAYFRRLLSQRKLFGQLAEYQRSHHGQDRTSQDLDAVVTLLTEELEHRFPDLWQPIEADMLVDELGLLHDPDDGPLLGCGICQEHERARHQQRRPARATAGSRHRARTGKEAA